MRRKWQPTPVFLPGESHGQRSLGGYSLWGHKESDMTELVTHILLSLIFYFSFFPKNLLSSICWDTVWLRLMYSKRFISRIPGGREKEYSQIHWRQLVLSLFSHVQLFATPWTAAHQVPLSMGFSRQEYWSGLPCPPPGDLLTQG